jgi:hypothetical protein
MPSYCDRSKEWGLERIDEEERVPGARGGAGSEEDPGHEKTSGQVPHELSHSSSGFGAVVYLVCPVNMHPHIRWLPPSSLGVDHDG